MTITLDEISTPYRYRAPSGEIMGVHEAARRAGQMLTSRGSVLEGALLTAEYHAAIANRDGLGDVIEELKKAITDDKGIRPEVAAISVIAHNATAIAARLQVYMQAFATEYRPVHPDTL